MAKEEGNLGGFAEGEGISVIGSLFFVLVSFFRGKRKCKFDVSGFLLEVRVGEKVVGGKERKGERVEVGEICAYCSQICPAGMNKIGCQMQLVSCL